MDRIRRSAAAGLSDVRGVPRQRALVAGEVRRQCADRKPRSLALPADAGQRQRQEAGDRVVELVRSPGALGAQQANALLGLAYVPQRDGQLDHGSPPAQPLEDAVQSSFALGTVTDQ